MVDAGGLLTFSVQMGIILTHFTVKSEKIYELTSYFCKLQATCNY